MHHRAGNEKERGLHYDNLYRLLAAMTPVKGVVFAAKVALEVDLPFMRKMQELLKEQETLEVRFEDVSHDYDAVMSKLTRFIGIGPPCHQPDSELLKALAAHDTSRWSSAQRLQNSHVNRNAPAMEPWRNKPVLLGALRNPSNGVAAQLRKYGVAFGYRYHGSVTAAFTAVPPTLSGGE